MSWMPCRYSQIMEIIQVKTGELRPAEYNPRKASERKLATVRDSIDAFGFVEPIIVNKQEGRENIIVGGWVRWTIAKERKMETVPVHYVDLTLEKEKELNLRLNKNFEDESWDWDLLKKFEADMLQNVGFDSRQLDELFSEGQEDDFAGEDEAAKIKKPKAQLGDIYELGGHRLMCGDSTKEDEVEKLMDRAKADMVFTDPPYNVNYESSGSLGGIKNDNMGAEAFIAFSEAFIKQMAYASKPGAPFYICSGYSSFPTFLYALRVNGFEFSTPIVWVKNNTSLGWGDYRHKNEMVIKTKKPADKKKGQPILYGWKEGRHYFAETRFEADVWEIKRRASNTMVHPTQKPLEIVRRAIENSSERGGAVLDLFGGSGSTLIACEQTGRKAYLMELDPKYVDVIVKRWERFTNKTAKKL